MFLFDDEIYPMAPSFHVMLQAIFKSLFMTVMSRPTFTFHKVT